VKINKNSQQSEKQKFNNNYDDYDNNAVMYFFHSK